MTVPSAIKALSRFASHLTSHPTRRRIILVTLITLSPALVFAQAGGTPFDTGFTALQTSSPAKVSSLIAIVIGGYQFAHGEPGSKRSRFGYVSVSRASHEATVFTNDATKLSQQIGTEITKTSALEVGQTPSIGHGLEMT